MVKVKQKGKTRPKFSIEDLMEQQVQNIDEAIEAIDRRLAPYKAIIMERERLVRARRALVTTGGVTGNAGTRVTVEEVYNWFKEHPGATTSEAAEHFGVALSTISSHTYRNKDRFIKKNGNVWARDPEAGIDTAEDVEE
jgi:hypothetical protein